MAAELGCETTKAREEKPKRGELEVCRVWVSLGFLVFAQKLGASKLSFSRPSPGLCPHHRRLFLSVQVQFFYIHSIFLVFVRFG